MWNRAAGSIPDDVIGIFHCLNPYNRTMALGWTELLAEISNRKLQLSGTLRRFQGLIHL
jgi:hypothetical protein